MNVSLEIIIVFVPLVTAGIYLLFRVNDVKKYLMSLSRWQTRGLGVVIAGCGSVCFALIVKSRAVETVQQAVFAEQAEKGYPAVWIALSILGLILVTSGTWIVSMPGYFQQTICKASNIWYRIAAVILLICAIVIVGVDIHNNMRFNSFENEMLKIEMQGHL